MFLKQSDFISEILYPGFIRKAVGDLPKITGKLRTSKLRTEIFSAAKQLRWNPPSFQIKEVHETENRMREKAIIYFNFSSFILNRLVPDNTRKFTWMEMDIWIPVRKKAVFNRTKIKKADIEVWLSSLLAEQIKELFNCKQMQYQSMQEFFSFENNLTWKNTFISYYLTFFLRTTQNMYVFMENWVLFHSTTILLGWNAKTCSVIQQFCMLIQKYYTFSLKNNEKKTLDREKWFDLNNWQRI